MSARSAQGHCLAKKLKASVMLESEMYEDTEADITRIINHVANGGNAAIRNKIVDLIMLQTGGSILSRGKICDLQCRRLSSGVSKIFLKPRLEPEAKADQHRDAS